MVKEVGRDPNGRSTHGYIDIILSKLLSCAFNITILGQPYTHKMGTPESGILNAESLFFQHRDNGSS